MKVIKGKALMMKNNEKAGQRERKGRRWSVAKERRKGMERER